MHRWSFQTHEAPFHHSFQRSLGEELFDLRDWDTILAEKVIIDVPIDASWHLFHEADVRCYSLAELVRLVDCHQSVFGGFFSVKLWWWPSIKSQMNTLGEGS